MNESSKETFTSPLNLQQSIPLTENRSRFITQARQKIVDILERKDARLLLIVGPCSIHHSEAAIEYALKLKELSQQVSDHFFIVMRTYFEKPRTLFGWKGMMYDPHMNNTHDIDRGLFLARSLLAKLTDLEIPTATEFLDPLTSGYIEDLISWSCVGARTAESQIHRQMASHLPMPVAFKNSTSGNIDIAVNGVASANRPHTFLGIDHDGRVAIRHSQGNPHAHIALRGGEEKPNYDPQSIAMTLERLKARLLPQRLIVDCSHDNSCRNHIEQTVVFESVINQYLQGNQCIRGLALESNLMEGNQRISSDNSKIHPGISLTDPCLGWEDTRDLILKAAHLMTKTLDTSYAELNRNACLS